MPASAVQLLVAFQRISATDWVILHTQLGRMGKLPLQCVLSVQSGIQSVVPPCETHIQRTGRCAVLPRLPRIHGIELRAD